MSTTKFTNEQGVQTEDTPISLGNLNTIPVADAIRYTQNWCDYNNVIDGQYNSPGNNYIRAFFVQKEDIIGMYELMQSSESMMGCRMYLGMEDIPVGPAAVNPAEKLKLAMVAVIQTTNTQNGIDVIVSPDDPEISLVYDFTKPCPSTCDMVSVLYHADAASV